MWCLLPIFYKKDMIDDRILVLFSKWYFRKIGTSSRTFNNLCYSSEFICITNCYLNDDTYDYYNEIERCLQKNMDPSVRGDKYETTLTGQSFTPTNATYLLLYLESCEATDIQTVPLNYTLEHIFPQKHKDKLSDTSLINNIGNLTLLEGKNSENGHKGNSSIGCKDHSTKVKSSYAASSSKITRSVATNHPTSFGEDDIKNRSKQLAELLDKYTQY